MQDQWLKGFVDLIVLSIIAEGDTYGYEIAKAVNQRTSGALQLKEGTLYPALRRLEAEELIRGYWATEREGPRRKYYTITPAGQAKLSTSRTAWQQQRRLINLFLGEAHP